VELGHCVIVVVFVSLCPIFSTCFSDSRTEYAKLVRNQSSQQKLFTAQSSLSKPPLKGANEVTTTSQDYPHVLTLKPDPEFDGDKTQSERTSTFWTQDLAERRRIQNRIAQRNYRSKKKQKLEELEKSKLAGDPNKDDATLKSDDNVLDPDVLAYQDPDETVVIECVCGNTDDRRFIIPCVTCGKWQHITCYYDLAQEVVDVHDCIQCHPRKLEDNRRQLLKRPVDMGPSQDAGSSATPSYKRRKTAGAESSNILSDGARSPLLASKSNYKENLEGKYASGVHYPDSIGTSLTSIRDNEKSVEQKSEDRINVAIQEIRTLIIPSQKGASGSFSAATTQTSISKASTLEVALRHIKQLRKRVREKDDLLGIRDREIKQLKKSLMPSTGKTSGATAPDTGHQSQEGIWGIITPDVTPHQDNQDDFLPNDTTLENFDFDSFLNPGPLPQLGSLSNYTLNDWLPYNIPRDAFTLFDAESPQMLLKGAAGRPEGLPEFNKSADNRSQPSVIMEDAREEAENDVQTGLSSTPKVVDQLDQPSGTPSGEDMDIVSDDRPDDLPDANMLTDMASTFHTDDWNVMQDLLPENWKWDVEFQSGCWTCTPLELDNPKHYPLTIGGAPVVLPVEHQWPPMGGVNPPPDPRPSGPIDCQARLPLDVVRDLFLTFEGSIGFYVLISGLLQIIVPEDFDTAWASSHLPHKYGGLKVCYIPQTMEVTMLPSTTETAKPNTSLNTQTSSLSSIFRQSRSTTYSSNPSLKLNDFIEARPKSNHRKDKYSGRIGLKVMRYGEPYLLMSTHIITEAIMAKSHRSALFRRGRDRFDKLDEDWNEHIEIWAGNEWVGEIAQSFDRKAEIYPDGFHHDVTLVKPKSSSSVKDIVSPVANLGWLNREAWNSLRQQTSQVKILGAMENQRAAKSLKCSRPSEILVVGEGIFLNQTAAAGNSRSLKDHDMMTWEKLISRALLYRVYPDFDPPNGYSGVALYAEGTRQDGTEGPGIVGFQSFVQRSGHVQNFNMEGPALEKRLQLGRVAFYGAFEVPEELKQEYTIV
jgi:hypothetical protein